MIGRIREPHYVWSRRCQFCGILLLTGEQNSGFCCGDRGKYAHILEVLPPLPSEILWLGSQPNISFLSRKLNSLFSFAAMETTDRFPVNIGPQGFLAIQG
ncbi:hypothetical protein M422DRAFT_191645 [Sphaerobolus stellatus SS14]|uniref:Uncharacterized protein n=1 Tax=Sphaerobolus stellatus (strain SS14) TaxID=990650 RepID=A0A0C9UNK8_SPHS4|nr:hypothetical protein M422DRAFT_191645 [Sphaerobolus stellatus SS14]